MKKATLLLLWVFLLQIGCESATYSHVRFVPDSAFSSGEQIKITSTIVEKDNESAFWKIIIPSSVAVGVAVGTGLYYLLEGTTHRKTPNPYADHDTVSISDTGADVAAAVGSLFAGMVTGVGLGLGVDWDKEFVGEQISFLSPPVISCVTEDKSWIVGVGASVGGRMIVEKETWERAIAMCPLDLLAISVREKVSGEPDEMSVEAKEPLVNVLPEPMKGSVGKISENCGGTPWIRIVNDKKDGTSILEVGNWGPKDICDLHIMRFNSNDPLPIGEEIFSVPNIQKGARISTEKTTFREDETVWFSWRGGFWYWPKNVSPQENETILQSSDASWIIWVPELIPGAFSPYCPEEDLF